MPSGNERIVIIDCCGQRFSKIIGYWLSEPVIGEKHTLEIFPGQGWSVTVVNIMPKKSQTNSYSFDAIFAESEDEDLFLCLCDCIGSQGWFEGDGACSDLSSGR